MCKMTLIVKGNPEQAIEACRKKGLTILDSKELSGYARLGAGTGAVMATGSTRVDVVGSFLTVGSWFSEPPYQATPEKPYPAGSLLLFRYEAK